MKSSPLVLSLTLIATSLFAAPQRADAGIIIATASGGSTVLLLGGAAAAVGGTFGAVVVVAAPDLSWFDPPVFGVALGAATAVLSTDGSLPEEALTRALEDRYPFIDQLAVYQSIARTVQKKAAELPAADGKRMIRFTRDEAIAFLEPLDLVGYEAEVDAFIRDLE